MNIQIFTDVAEANKFINTVKNPKVDYNNGEIIVFYEPELSVEQVRANKIREDENKALVGLERAQMHLEFLNEVARHDPDNDDKVKGGIENTKLNINNYKSTLAVVERWKEKN